MKRSWLLIVVLVATTGSAAHGITGGGAYFATGVFVLGQRFNFTTFDPADKLPTLATMDETGRPATLQDLGICRATTVMLGIGCLDREGVVKEQRPS